ncbi:MAG: diacylglycerol/lipid kinase family protein, partial [Bdellovibrionota bacterium]
PKATDVGRVKWMGMAGREGRYFLNLASFGFPGLVVQRVSTKAGIWGRSRLGNSALTYLAQSASALLEYRPLEVEVKADGKPFFSGKIFSGFVLNGRYNAGGVDWHKDARIDDGEFHLLVMEPRNPVATALSAGKMISGDWEGTAGVHITRAKSVEVSLKGDARKLFPLFEVDGDQPEAPDSRGAVFEILPGAIQVWR